jgi:agmatine deiminase
VARSPSPAALGFRLCAEWEPHEATWLAWPHRASDWPGKLGVIPWVYGEIVRALAPGELVRIVVRTRDEQRRANRVLDGAGVAGSRIEYFLMPTDRSWIRDFGPCFVRRDRDGALAVARLRFTAWAKYADWRRDDRIPERVARRLGLELLPAEVAGEPFVLEGGSIDVNGRGTLLTTEECLLDPTVQVRNPGATRTELEEAMAATLAASTVVWLGRGIAGDDTHGHVDDLCRFVNPRTVVLCEERNPRDPNHRALEENRERLEGARLEDGSRPEVIRLPMPAPLYFDEQRLPASYANFYVANAVVLVPTFNDPQDRVALGLLGELFDRPVVGIHAVDLVWGLGTIHCLTHEEPASGLRPASTPPTSR